jgi:outer membrane PBP1 activator LpoA protein
MRIPSILPVALASLLILTSVGCQITQPIEPDVPPAHADAGAEALLRRATDAAPAQAAVLRLAAAQQLQDLGEPARAYAILTVIDTTLLTKPKLFDHHWHAARAALDLGAADDAWRWIQAARPTDAGQAYLRDLETARIAQARNDYVVAAQVLMRIDIRRRPAADDLTQQRLNDEIWDTLRGAPSPSVAALAGTSTDPIAAPWWRLAAGIDRAFDLAEQRRVLDVWLLENPGHPASVTLPSRLATLSMFTIEASTIGLFLPLSGPLAGAGGAVRDGFLAAYYHQPEHQPGHRPEHPNAKRRVLLYDTGQASPDALYEQALADRVDLIVGPLSKSAVTTLHALAFRQIPVLALNYLPEVLPIPAIPDAIQPRPDESPGITAASPNGDFFQFGLAIEDEARAIAIRVAGDGSTRVVLLLSDTDWPERAAEAFLANWQADEDSVLETAYVDDVRSMTNVVGRALHVDASSARMQTLAAAIGQPVEFIPRRRQDIDAVVAFVDAEQGGAVRPALAYHFASDLPVYATSQVTSGPGSNRLRELNLMRICQLPWSVYPDKVKNEFAAAFARQSPGPLHALGVDAYRLADRLALFAADPHARLLGATGILTLDESRVSRDLIWSVVHDGRLEPLPTVVY